MTTRYEAAAAVRAIDKTGGTASDRRTVVAWWRGHVQPAVPTLPDGLELVCDPEGVSVFRLVTKADYGWLEPDGHLWRVGRCGMPPRQSDPFGGKRYIVRQSDPKETP